MAGKAHGGKAAGHAHGHKPVAKKMFAQLIGEDTSKDCECLEEYGIRFKSHTPHARPVRRAAHK